MIRHNDLNDHFMLMLAKIPLEFFSWEGSPVDFLKSGSRPQKKFVLFTTMRAL